jgi:hypothetical protein
MSAAGYLLGTQLASCDFGAFLTSIMAYLMDNTQKNPGDAVITTSLGSKRDYNPIYPQHAVVVLFITHLNG